MIIVIDGEAETVKILEAPEGTANSHILAKDLTEAVANSDAGKDLVKVSIVSAGDAAEHSLIGMLNFSFYDPKRKEVRFKQAGRGGIGTVFRNKKIKALVAKVPKISGNLNNVADMKPIVERGKRFNREMKELDESQAQMRSKGTAHLTNIMNDS